MTIIIAALCGIQAVVILAGILTYRTLLQNLRQTKLLQAQMEEDHAILVQNTIQANNLLHDVRTQHEGIGQ